VSGVTEVLSRKIRKRGVSVHSKPINTIRSKLVAPKDRTKKMDKSGVVYQLKCSECDEDYVGETERKLQKRVSEHHKHSSPFGEHLLEHSHHLENDNIRVLDREQRWFQRGVKEAIYINALTLILNRDWGRHQLPATYTSLIHSHGRQFTHGDVN
jgi:hypothetical protein